MRHIESGTTDKTKLSNKNEKALLQNVLRQWRASRLGRQIAEELLSAPAAEYSDISNKQTHANSCKNIKNYAQQK